MIPVAKISSWFDLICDKVANPYFTDAEKAQFWNNATQDYLNNLFKIGEAAAEFNSIQGEVIGELSEFVTLNTDADGGITVAAIETAMGSSKKYFRALNIRRANVANSCDTLTDDNYKLARYVRHNDYNSQKDNYYKRPTEDYPIYRLMPYIKLDPSGVRSTKLTVMRYPADVVLSGTTVDSEMPLFTFQDIMLMALAYAGISIREQELKAMVDNELQK